MSYNFATEEISREQAKEMSRELFEKLASDDQTLYKEAASNIQDYIRYKIREDSIFDRLHAPTPVSNSDLTRVVHTDKPSIVIDKETDSPAAVTVGFASLPTSVYIRGSRFVMSFDRMFTNRFAKDVVELRTYNMDIRQILSDNSIRDMLAEWDGKILAACNSVLIGPNQMSPFAETRMFEEYSSDINRDSLWESMKIMPSSISNFETASILMNHLTLKDLCKMGRDEVGGDMAQDIMKRGYREDTVLDRKLVTTIKRDLVPNGKMYHFADMSMIAKNLTLEDVTMHVKREAYMIEFFTYTSRGFSIGNPNGIAAVQFKGR